jgi:hypothetical protein
MNRNSMVFLGLEWSMQKYSFDANSYGNSSHQIKHKNVILNGIGYMVGLIYEIEFGSQASSLQMPPKTSKKS